MHNLSHQRSLVLSALLFAVAMLSPLSASAATYTISDSVDIMYGTKLGGVVETTYGWSASVYIDAPSSVTPSSSYSITVSKSLTGSNWMECKDSPGESSDCQGHNVEVYTSHNSSFAGLMDWTTGTQSYTVTSGASGSNTISATVQPSAGYSIGAPGLPPYRSFGAFSGSVTIPISAAAPTPVVTIFFQ